MTPILHSEAVRRYMPHFKSQARQQPRGGAVQGTWFARGEQAGLFSQGTGPFTGGSRQVSYHRDAGRFTPLSLHAPPSQTHGWGLDGLWSADAVKTGAHLPPPQASLFSCCTSFPPNRSLPPLLFPHTSHAPPLHRCRPPAGRRRRCAGARGSLCKENGRGDIVHVRKVGHPLPLPSHAPLPLGTAGHPHAPHGQVVALRQDRWQEAGAGLLFEPPPCALRKEASRHDGTHETSRVPPPPCTLTGCHRHAHPAGGCRRVPQVRHGRWPELAPSARRECPLPSPPCSDGCARPCTRRPTLRASSACRPSAAPSCSASQVRR